MLNFTELPKDGVRFEQLVRDLLLRAGLRPHWTGVGADSGRDLLATEHLIGPLRPTEALWLVDCKHFAHSGRSVSVKDVTDIVDRCQRVSATGFLLATSTQPTAELTRKLLELQQKHILSTLVWDGVELENRLLTHSNYALAQRAFPSSPLDEWQIFYTEREERWTAHYKGQFLFVESRSGIDPPDLRFLGQIVDELQAIPTAVDENVRVRAIWHDTPNGCFYNCWADYLVPVSKVPSLTKHQVERSVRENIDGQVINWDIRLQLTLPDSDYYDLDDDALYLKFREPLYHAIYRARTSTASEGNPDWWEVHAPKIRRFSDAFMWNQHKEMHGFSEEGVISPPYRRAKTAE